MFILRCLVLPGDVGHLYLLVDSPPTAPPPDDVENENNGNGGLAHEA
jgi:hypothetical protein